MDGVLHKPFTLTSMGECLGRFITAVEAGYAAAAEHVEAGADDAVLDSTLVAQLRDMAAMGRGDFVVRVTSLYREHAPKALADIEAAHAAQDSDALGRAAHALKSMSYNVGAKRVAALSAALEKQARENSSAGGIEEIANLHAAISEACSQLQTMADAA